MLCQPIYEVILIEPHVLLRFQVLGTRLLFGILGKKTSIDEDLVWVFDLKILLHESIVNFVVGGIDGEGAFAGLDGFVVFFEFGVAEGHIEEGIFIVGMLLAHIFVVQLYRLLVFLTLERLVSPLLQAHLSITPQL